MKLPKIEFSEMSLEENINIVKWAYFDIDDTLNIHDFTIKYFPELANIDKNLSQSEIYKIIEEVVTKNYNENKDEIKSEVDRYNNLWKDYNDKYFESLSTYFNVDWPDNINVIKATIGFIPIFPRYLDNFSFSICTGVNDSTLIKVCAHETLHFMWFEKWKKIHPETPRIEYDSPYITWKYSEMVTDPILNNKPFKDMFEFTEHGYDSFYELEDGDTKVMDNLRNIYSENISIEEKIEKGFEYIKKILNEEESVKITKK